MNEKLKYKIISAVEKLGLKQSRQMFGDNLIQQAYINNPLLFLNQFNNLIPVEEDGDVIYVDNNDEIIFSYHKKDQDSKSGYYWIRVGKNNDKYHFIKFSPRNDSKYGLF